MSHKISPPENERYQFICPACLIPHAFVNGPWTWNFDFEMPTIEPSLLMRRTMGNYLPADHPDFETHEEVCHSYIREGKIQFLSDCTHELAGQTVDLPDWDRMEEVSE